MNTQTTETDRRAAVLDRYREELRTGVAAGYIVASNRSADRMNYRPMPPARTYGDVLVVLGRAAGMGDLYAYAVDLAVRKVSPYLTDWQIKANVAEAFQDVIRKGWHDTRTETGPTPGRPSSHERTLSLAEVVMLHCILTELEYVLNLGVVPGIGWALRDIMREERVNPWATYLPRVTEALAE